MTVPAISQDETLAGSYDKRQLLKTAYNYAQDGQWDRALREYQTISRLFPDDANVHSMVADIFARTGKIEDGVREYQAAARLQADQLEYGKQMATLQKILRISPGNIAAEEEVGKNIERRLSKARSLFGQERYDEAEQLCNDLLDADPGSVGVNRLLDDIKNENVRRQSAVDERKEQEKAQQRVEAKKQDVGEQATREVLSRLESTADQYLAAGDFDNAIETMLIMLKIDPGMSEVRELLEETQRLLEKRRVAQDVWFEMQNAQVRSVESVKAVSSEVKSQEEWMRHEQEMKSRMERERAAAEQIHKEEQEIIERAVAEMEAQKAAAALEAQEEAMQIEAPKLPELVKPEAEKRQAPRLPDITPPDVKHRGAVEKIKPPSDSQKRTIMASPLSAIAPMVGMPGPQKETPVVNPQPEPEMKPGAMDAFDARDLMALASKRANARSAVDARNLTSRLELEAAASQKKYAPSGDQKAGPRLDTGFRADTEMLEHAIEMAKHEAEAKAREHKAEDLEKELAQVRRESEERLSEERERSARQELELRRQLRELMAEEMAKVKAEVRDKAMEDVRLQLIQEQESRRKREEQEKVEREIRENEIQARKDLENRLRDEAEAKIKGERRAIAHLQKYHDDRKTDFVAQARARREEREKGSQEGQKVVRTSRQISDAIRAAATKHIAQDLGAMLATAKRYLDQDLLLDAMKMCQQITEADPANEEVKNLLKEIYIRKGL